MTLTEAEDAMRAAVGESVAYQCEVMYAMADGWDEHEDASRCVECKDGLVYTGMDGTKWIPCMRCEQGWVSNGMSLRAEALRLLAECGKVGEELEGCRAYAIWSLENKPASVRVPQGWWFAADAIGYGLLWKPLVDARLALMDAYANADQPTRERWAAETRALVPGATVECPACFGHKTWIPRNEYGWGGEERPCFECQGTGRVPARTEGVTT